MISLLKGWDYDVIQLETLYLAPYIDTIRKYSKAQIVMRSHNVEFEIWNRIASNTSFLPKRWYLQHLTKKLRRFELESLNKYDAMATVTQRDLDSYRQLGYDGLGFAIPIGIDINDYQPRMKENEISISFIGSLDWIPNLEGLNWFLEKVWPQVVRECPDVKLHIAGRNTPNEIRALTSENLIIEGEVDDAKEFINAHSIMIVPLLSGSGMRVKILEGMALQRTIVSSSIGMEGIPATDKKEILIADTPNQFAEALIWAIQNPQTHLSIGSQARMFIQSYFDRTTNAKKFINQINPSL